MTNYQPGEGGVNVVKNPLQLADNELTRAQNAEFNPDVDGGGQGALTKRGGLQKLFSGALGGAIYGMIATGLEAPIEPDGWALDQDETDDFITDVSEATSYSFVGESTGWEAMGDGEDSSYFRFVCGVTEGGSGDTFTSGGGYFRFALKTDPSHDTGFKLVVRARANATTDPDWASSNVLIQLWVGMSAVASFELNVGEASGASVSETQVLSSTFVTHEFDLSEAQVQAIRSAGGFASGRTYLWLSPSLDTDAAGGHPMAVNFDFAEARIEITAP